MSLAKMVCCSAMSCVPHLVRVRARVRVRVGVGVRVKVRGSAPVVPSTARREDEGRHARPH